MAALIVANWKMNPHNARAAKVLVAATKRALTNSRGISVVIAPPSLFLHALAKGNKSSKVTFAAQHAHHESAGAFTGEISMSMVRDSGATHVIVGHSERRAAGETNEDVRKQVKAALDARLKPIICVGELVRDEEGDYLEGFTQQLLEGLADVPKTALRNITIAYEPVWNIGKEESMSPNDMHEMSLYIRKTLMKLFEKQALSIPILYGGSITEANAKAMLDDGQVQGVLVGHVSVDPRRFTQLLKAIR